MLNKQCTTLPNVYCCLSAFSDFDCFWVRLDDCVKSKDENSYQMSHFAKSVLWSELLSSQFTKSLTKDRDCRGVVTNTYRFKNRPIWLGPHLTINDCTSVRLFAYMSEQDKNNSQSITKNSLKKKLDTICLKYSLSGSQNFIVIGFWNQSLPNTSRVSLAST